MRKHLSIIIASMILCISCAEKGDGYEKAESSSSTPRMEMAGSEVFSYVPATCQLGFNREKCEFRMHSDTMSDFVVARLSAIPTEKGQKLSADLEWTTERDTKTKNNVSFKVEKIEEDVCWLWNRADRITLVVRLLD